MLILGDCLSPIPPPPPDHWGGLVWLVTVLRTGHFNLNSSCVEMTALEVRYQNRGFNKDFLFEVIPLIHVPPQRCPPVLGRKPSRS